MTFDRSPDKDRTRVPRTAGTGASWKLALSLQSSTGMIRLAIPLAVAISLVAFPAQAATGAGTPAIRSAAPSDPSPQTAPPPIVPLTPASGREVHSEAGTTAGQVVVGTLSMLLLGYADLVGSIELHSVPFAVVGGLIAPALGGLIVCQVGRGSTSYEGDCPPVILGGYIGALALGVPLAIWGYTHPGSDGDGGSDRMITLAVGLVLGAAVGTAIGATVGWTVAKRRRQQNAVSLRLAPASLPLPSDGNADLRGGSTGPATPRSAGLQVSIPLLALQF
jgi:hypothetical protein